MNMVKVAVILFVGCAVSNLIDCFAFGMSVSLIETVVRDVLLAGTGVIAVVVGKKSN